MQRLKHTNLVRAAIIPLALCALTAAGHANSVWMVKSGNVLACYERQTLIDVDEAPADARREDQAPKGCIILFSGERLLEQPEFGLGFNKYMKAEREDGSVLYVRSADVVSDPGIGDVTDDR
ncbi:hypothetical protein APY04_0521 [Hyphomicrobium sulfonivorans]|uniref:Uncharacterized protein n=1 Tax=Hyphomicrobium sulfonivorans TaxID=121290 RepID=A0A109BMM9_HYPSL|nr:hypothetical protein [Hyphomicrobium sulfonivorans]KWT71270.1 hypothetical protein APY04_0521 [Hyphomicrobium sulfonivorans]